MASVFKTIEVMGQSSKSWEDAVQTVVTEAKKTVKGIQSVCIPIPFDPATFQKTPAEQRLRRGRSEVTIAELPC